MKKPLYIFLAIIFIFTPFLILGESSVKIDGDDVPEPSCCCKLKHKIDIGGDERDAGTVLMEPGCDSCSFSSVAKIEHPSWTGYCFLDGVITVSDTITWVAAIFVGVSLIFVGIIYISARGNEEKMLLARKMFYGTITGIMIAIFANFIPSIVRFFIPV